MNKNGSKILIIEDDPNITDLIDMYMIKMGYETIIAHDGEEGLQKYEEEKPDCIILDLMLPKRSGWEICELIRLDDPTIPILMLTGKGESEDIVHGLGIGADDYIVKPFDPNELSARVKAALRRTHHEERPRKVLHYENLMINMKEFKVYANDQEISMAPRELELLYFFASNPKQVLTKQQLLDEVWGLGFEGDPRTIDVHLKRIRDKLARHRVKWSITTIRGVGYRFEEIADD